MRTFLASTSAAIALAVPAAGASPALASTCRPYSATGHDAATSPAGPYVGFQDVTLGSTRYSDVPAVTTILAPLAAEGRSGVLTTKTSHTIFLPAETITTIDDVHLIPTDDPAVYRLVSHLVVTGGDTGQIQLQGSVDFGTLTAEGSFVGTVCGPT